MLAYLCRRAFARLHRYGSLSAYAAHTANIFFFVRLVAATRCRHYSSLSAYCHAAIRPKTIESDALMPTNTL